MSYYGVMDEIKNQDSNISILQKYQSEIFWNKIKNLEFFATTKNNIIRERKK